MGIPELIRDLAIMLLTAGIITVIFKKIKQPLILGYILAGFLLSPYFPWFAGIVDTEAISTWSEIGIIILMFHLGLEFNLHKLAEVGSTAFITCMVEVIGMLALGYAVGCILGFSGMDSLVLGAMLVMSSTTIIIKVFSELHIKEKYTELVFGVLVIEDIVGIFMMVIMSTAAVSHNVSGTEVAGQLLLMVLYLVIWLVLGIYILPTLMARAIRFMNDEMLQVCSVGICFAMVLLAGWLGFSSALGAFLAGSLLAGTVHVERVEELTTGVKDLFGAVFFISVGMMADPAMIAKYWLQILVIIIVTVIGKLLFNTLGMLISGQSLRNSVQSGFALAQIGEFAFIIANLGCGLGLIDDFLYPIVVAVSVITTFTTPFCIKAAPKFADFLETRLPEKVLAKLNRYTSEEQSEKNRDSEWKAYLKRFLLRTVIFGGLMLVAAMAGTKTLVPALSEYIPRIWAEVVTCVIIFGIMAIFTGPLLDRRNNLYTSLWLKGLSFRLPLTALNVLKLVIIAVIAAIPVNRLFGIDPLGIVLALVMLLVLVSGTGIISTWYLNIETRFLRNFNERLIKKEEAEGNRQKWLDETLHIISFYVDSDRDFLGKTIRELDWGSNSSVYVVKMKKEGRNIVLPSPETHINAGDKLYVAGEKKALENFYKAEGVEKTREIRTLKEFMDSGYESTEDALSLVAIKVRGDEKFAGKPIKNGNFKSKYSLMIMGLQKDGLPIIMPDPNMMISRNDILWVMGSNLNAGRLVSEYLE